MSDVKYPNITATVTGGDGNVFAVIGTVSKALRRGGVPREEVNAFTEEVMSSGSYDEALQTCMKWIRLR